MFSQLTLHQRCLIDYLHRKGYSQSAIAREVEVHRSTIKRELDRNSINGEYKAMEAHSATLYRKAMAGTISQIKNKRRFFDFQPKEDSQKRRTYQSRKRKNRLKDRRNRFFQIRLKRRGPDPRFWNEKANKKRKEEYRHWKRKHERNYRLRDHLWEEKQRTYRSRELINSYWKEGKLRWWELQERSLRRLEKDRYARRIHQLKIKRMREELEEQKLRHKKQLIKEFIDRYIESLIPEEIKQKRAEQKRKEALLEAALQQQWEFCLQESLSIPTNIFGSFKKEQPAKVSEALKEQPTKTERVSKPKIIFFYRGFLSQSARPLKENMFVAFQLAEEESFVSDVPP
jgi:hypothetical protein